jgi:hypothetical protein
MGAIGATKGYRKLCCSLVLVVLGGWRSGGGGLLSYLALNTLKPFTARWHGHMSVGHQHSVCLAGLAARVGQPMCGCGHWHAIWDLDEPPVVAGYMLVACDPWYQLGSTCCRQIEVSRVHP